MVRLPSVLLRSCRWFNTPVRFVVTGFKRESATALFYEEGVQ
jgi:hypothetical protein